MSQTIGRKLLLLATLYGIVLSSEERFPTHNPRGWSAALRELERPTPHTVPSELQLEQHQSSLHPQESTSTGVVRQSEDTARSSASWPLPLSIGFLLLGFAVGWRLTSAQYGVQLEAVMLRHQADLESLQQQQDGAPQQQEIVGAAFAVTHQPECSSSIPALLERQQATEDASESNLVDSQEPVKHAAAPTGQGRLDFQLDQAHIAPAESSSHPPPPAAASPRSNSSSSAADADLVLVSRPEQATSPGQTSTSAASTAISTPARPPNQRMQDSPVQLLDSGFSQMEISGATSLVAAVHVGLRSQGVPEAQRALVADNVLSVLAMQKREQQHAATHRQGEEANQWRKVQGMAAVGSLGIKREKAEAVIADKKLQALRASLTDGLQFGLCIMLASALYCAFSYGFLEIRLGRCRSLSSLESVSLRRPWVPLQFAEILFCWTLSAWQFLTGAAVMLLVAKLVCLRGWSENTHRAPLMKLVLGLGALCGLIGYMTISWTGGIARLWLGLWEAWVLMHTASAWKMPRLLTWLEAHTDSDIQGPGHLKPVSLAWRPVVFHLVAAAALPVATGVLPFTMALL